MKFDDELAPVESQAGVTEGARAGDSEGVKCVKAISLAST